MKVLSLFDGISCAREALKRIGAKVDKYYASEIDKYAIEISKKNWTDIIHIGDVKDVGGKSYEVKFCKNDPYKVVSIDKETIDLLIGGSPCQDLSIAKAKRKGLDGERSSLFYEYVRILNDVKPKYFILENVASMSKESRDKITEIMGVEPVMINASLVSAQNRKRLFWVGERVDEINSKGEKFNTSQYKQVTIPQPQDKGILLKDILENDVDEKYIIKAERKNTLISNRPQDINKPKANTLLVGGTNPTLKIKNLRQGNDKAVSMSATMYKGYGNDGVTTIRIGSLNSGGQGDRIYSQDGKSTTLSANGGGRGAKTGLYDVKDFIRKLTPIECERLQGLPDNYTDGISNTQRYKCLGNAFNVDVVAHILTHLTHNK